MQFRTKRRVFAAQVHSEMFGDSHKMVPIGSMAFEQIHLCGVHRNKPVSVACSRCLEIFCINCLHGITTCQAGGKNKSASNLFPF